MKAAPLYEGNWVHLTGMNLDRNPAVEARLSGDLDYVRQVREHPLGPLSAFELKKHHEETLKEAVKTGNVVAYNTRAVCCYERLGFVEEGRERENISRDGQRWDVV